MTSRSGWFRRIIRRSDGMGKIEHDASEAAAAAASRAFSVPMESERGSRFLI
jgi:hypothetical protein